MNNSVPAINKWLFLLFLVFLAVGFFLVWSKKEWFLSQLNLGKTAIKKEEEALVKHNLGPIAPGCLVLPQKIDPLAGNAGYQLGEGQDSLDTFIYTGQIISFKVEEVEGVKVGEVEKVGKVEEKCKFYVVSLLRGGKTTNVYLPWNLKSIPSQSNKEIGDSDGQVLQQFKGQKVKLTIQYQKEAEKRKFFSWKVEVM